MKFHIREKNFVKGSAEKKTTLSLTEPMYEALSGIAAKTNDSIPETIVEALEQYLTSLAQEGIIPFPGEEKKNQTKKRA